MVLATDSQRRVSHDLIEFLINVFKGDDFVISVFVSECYLPILAKGYGLSNTGEVLIGQLGDSLVLFLFLSDIDDPWPCCCSNSEANPLL